MSKNKSNGGMVSVGSHTRNGYDVDSYMRSYPNSGGAGDNSKIKKPKLENNSSTNNNIDEKDILGIKNALYHLGYYNPESKSELNENFHEYPNINLTNAIKNFQKDNDLPATGKINQLTIDVLNSRNPDNRTSVKMSDDGINKLKSLEGNIENQKKSGSYKNGMFYIHDDGKNIPTIGYGHKIKDSEKFSDGITEKEAENLLRKDIEIAESDYMRLIGKNAMNQNQIDAIISFLYNVGGTKVKGSNTINMLKNNIDIHPQSGKTLEQEFKEWISKGTKVEKGLRNRRDKEWEWMKKTI